MILYYNLMHLEYLVGRRKTRLQQKYLNPIPPPTPKPKEKKTKKKEKYSRDKHNRFIREMIQSSYICYYCEGTFVAVAMQKFRYIIKHKDSGLQIRDFVHRTKSSKT